jgi:PBP1b-binding outer membrane lipoprotein LpoB
MKKIFVSLLVLSLLLTGCKQKTEEENNPVEEGATILETKEVGGLTFENFIIVTDSSNITYITFDIVNNTDASIDINKVTFALYSSEDKILEISKSVDGPIEASDIREITAKLDIDLDGIDDVEYTIE